MRRLPALPCFLALAACAFGQTYTIRTVAGGAGVARAASFSIAGFYVQVTQKGNGPTGVASNAVTMAVKEGGL